MLTFYVHYLPKEDSVTQVDSFKAELYRINGGVIEFQKESMVTSIYPIAKIVKVLVYK